MIQEPAIVTVSDSVAAGTREDRSGAVLRERAEALGWQVTAQETVPDEMDRIARFLRGWRIPDRFPLILTTGGTGVAPRDVTPEAARTVIEREIPGLGEMMRAEGRKLTPFAALSRSMAGVRGTYFDRKLARIAERGRGIVGCNCATYSPHHRSNGREDRARRCAKLELCATLWMLLLCAVGFAQQQPGTLDPAKDPAKIAEKAEKDEKRTKMLRSASRTNIVIAPTTVLDKHGDYVNGLQLQDFQLYDNNKLQNITADVHDEPLSLVVAVQKSSNLNEILPKIQRIGSC